MTPPPPSDPRGCVLVPREPTERMLVEGYGFSDLFVDDETHDWKVEMRCAYQAMLAAAPIPPVDQKPIAWRYEGPGADGTYYTYFDHYEPKADGERNIVPLYAAPPADREAIRRAALEEAVKAACRWLDEIATNTDMAEIVADGGVTAGMVVQQEAQEQRRRLLRALAAGDAA